MWSDEIFFNHKTGYTAWLPQTFRDCWSISALRSPKDDLKNTRRVLILLQNHAKAAYFPTYCHLHPKQPSSRGSRSSSVSLPLMQVAELNKYSCINIVSSNASLRNIAGCFMIKAPVVWWSPLIFWIILDLKLFGSKATFGLWSLDDQRWKENVIT